MQHAEQLSHHMYTHEERVCSLTAAHEAKHEDTVAAHTRALAASTAFAFSQHATHEAVVALVVREHESYTEALTDRHEVRVSSLSAAHEAKHEGTVAAHTRALAASTACAFSQRAVHEAVAATVVREHESYTEALTVEHAARLNQKHQELAGNWPTNRTRPNKPNWTRLISSSQPVGLASKTLYDPSKPQSRRY